MAYLEKIGIFGWNKIEPIIFACILGGKAVLLKAAHGANKTEGCRAISQAFFGQNSKFVPYDTSLVNADDLLGYPNPKSLQEGRIEFIKTPDSIWDADSALLDELNRCNPYTAAKFFEIARARTINGRDTALKFVWAACNPPDKYNTATMDPAQVSRFVVLDVPTFKNLAAVDKKNLLKAQSPKSMPNMAALLDKARNTKVSRAQEETIRKLSLKLGERLTDKSIEFSSRQVCDLFTLFMNMDRVSMVFEDLPKVTEESLTMAVLGLIPETSGLIRGSIDTSSVRGEISTILRGFQLSDPILTASSLTELASASGKDMSGWAGALTDMLMVEENPAQVTSAWQEITNRTDLDPSIFNSLRQSFAVKQTMLGIDSPNTTPVASLGTKLTSALAGYGPKQANAVSRKKTSKRKKKGL